MSSLRNLWRAFWLGNPFDVAVQDRVAKGGEFRVCNNMEETP